REAVPARDFRDERLVLGADAERVPGGTQGRFDGHGPGVVPDLDAWSRQRAVQTGCGQRRERALDLRRKAGHTTLEVGQAGREVVDLSRQRLATVPGGEELGPRGLQRALERGRVLFRDAGQLGREAVQSGDLGLEAPLLL